ncbi:MAG: ABC transporter substrate-binding protein [Deltaproteobacteria bacterium]|nr:ABC transporter substrate-binding protein [Deltaproteobacteria bacterium]
MNQLQSTWLVLALIFNLSSVPVATAQGTDGEIRIGWIGALTGPVAKYGTHQAATLAVEDINAEGGIRGRKLTLVTEDGQCKGPAAVAALRKLVSSDRVRFILGGHCSPESLAIAPLLSNLNVLALAACSTSPKLTGVSPNFVRLSPPSIIVGDMLAATAFADGRRRGAVIAEETDYAMPPAAHFKELFTRAGGVVADSFDFATADQDHRGLVSRIRALNVDGIYLGTQSKDTAILLVRQLRDQGVRLPIYGNEQVGNAPNGENSEIAKMFDGIVFADPEFDVATPKSAAFAKRYSDRFGTKGLPLGVWTAEAYDSVRLLARAIAECGDEIAQVRECLIKTENVEGVSGLVTILPNGDGARRYVVKVVQSNGSAIVRRPS